MEHGSNCCETHIRSWWLFSFLFNSSDWATELTQSRRGELTETPPHGHFSARDRLSGRAALCWLSTSIFCSFLDVKTVIACLFVIQCSEKNILFQKRTGTLRDTELEIEEADLSKVLAEIHPTNPEECSRHRATHWLHRVGWCPNGV